MDQHPDRGHGACSDCQHDQRTRLDLAVRWMSLVGGVAFVLVAFIGALVESQLR